MATRAPALPPPPPHPALLIDDLVEQFLLRLPPEDPAVLARAALVSRQWHRVLAAHGFRRRFRELHRRRRPAMLGFFSFLGGYCFTPTSSFCPPSFHRRNARFQGQFAMDSRHGRVLLAKSFILSQSLQSNSVLAVWDPISGNRLELPQFPAPQQQLLDSVVYTWNASVLCASNANHDHACDNIDCHFGRFLVVLMIASQFRVYVFVYSSQAGTWSETTSAAQDPLGLKCLLPLEAGVLAGNALYFKFGTRQLSNGILKYDLVMQEISWVNLPSNYRASEILLTTTEYGGLLGIARVESSRLHLWSEEVGPDGHLGWAPNRVIELNMVLPANTHSIDVVAFLHGLGAFLVNTNNGVFSVDLESNQARKVCEDSCGKNVVPYVCFCTPAPDVAPKNTGEGPEASVPSQVHQELKFVVKQ